MEIDLKLTLALPHQAVHKLKHVEWIGVRHKIIDMNGCVARLRQSVSQNLKIFEFFIVPVARLMNLQSVQQAWQIKCDQHHFLAQLKKLCDLLLAELVCAAAKIMIKHKIHVPLW